MRVDQAFARLEERFAQADYEPFFGHLGYQPHPAQWAIHRSRARYRVVAAGRRFGKSKLAAHEILSTLVLPEKRVWVVAPTHDLTRKVLREVFWVARRRLKQWIAEDVEYESRLALHTGSWVQGKSADNPVSLVGEGLDLLVVDEAGRLADVLWTEALEPTLLDRHGRALFISTPRGKNWFYRLWREGQDPTAEYAASWQYPTTTNPHIDAAWVETQRQRVPDRTFRQEYLAEFIDDAGEVFRNVRGCIHGEPEDPKPGRVYCIGWDPARLRDFSVVTVMDCARKHVVHFDRTTGLDWQLQCRRVAELSRQYHGALVVLDASGVGDPLIRALQDLDVAVHPVTFSPKVKLELIDTLVIAVENRRLTYPEIPELIAELEDFTYERTEAGNIRYHGDQLHDDCVMSLALAWSYAHRYAGEPETPNRKEWPWPLREEPKEDAWTPW